MKEMEYMLELQLIFAWFALHVAATSDCKWFRLYVWVRARARILWAKCFLVKFMSTFSLNMHCTVPNRAGIAFTSFVELTLFIEHRRKIIYRSRCFWLLSTCNKHFLTRWHPNLLMKHTKLQLFLRALSSHCTFWAHFSAVLFNVWRSFFAR